MFDRRSDLVKLIAVADAGGILAAAERLAITQPALGRVIARLELRFGGRLFERLADIDGAWQTIRARAALHDVRMHDIRHSFASRALALGEGLPIIGRLLGHRRIETTARYAHLARDSVKESAERIAVSIAADIL